MSKELARDLAVLKALKDRIKVVEERVRGEFLAEADPGDRTTAKLPTGAPLGAVSVSAGRKVARVVDEAALLEWVKSEHPTEAVHEWRVRPAYLSKLLDHVRDTGEVIPGVELGTGDPYITVRLAAGAHEAIGQAWGDGNLPALAALRPELPGGEQ